MIKPLCSPPLRLSLPFSFCVSLLYSPLNGSWRGCWDEEDDELTMALAVLVRLWWRIAGVLPLFSYLSCLVLSLFLSVFFFNLFLSLCFPLFFFFPSLSRLFCSPFSLCFFFFPLSSLSTLCFFFAVLFSPPVFLHLPLCFSCYYRPETLCW